MIVALMLPLRRCRYATPLFFMRYAVAICRVADVAALLHYVCYAMLPDAAMMPLRYTYMFVRFRMPCIDVTLTLLRYAVCYAMFRRHAADDVDATPRLAPYAPLVICAPRTSARCHTSRLSQPWH